MSAEPLALVSSLSWGTADFLGGLGSRRARAQAVTAVTAASGLVLLLVLVPFLGFRPTAVSVACGLTGGLASAAALLSFYAALATGRMSVVAPLVSTSALVPVVVGVAQGDRPGLLKVAGIVVAVLGVVLAGGPELSGGNRRSLVLAGVAAVGFGTALTLYATGGRSDEASTLVLGRLTTTVVASAVALRTGGLAVPRKVVPLALAAGAGDAGANVLVVLAAIGGALSTVAVFGSLYPVVTVLLARGVLKERLAGVQVPGVVLTLIGVVALAAG